MDGKYIKYYKKIYNTRTDYKRELTPLYENINIFLRENPKSMLDYGCGQGNLADIFQKKKQCTIYKYDPAIEEYATLINHPVDLITNSDVLEHIPEDEIPVVLKNISRLSKNAFFAIHLKEASEILENGQNAHCTIQKPQWWQSKIKEYFPNAYIVPSLDKNACCIITWKPPFLSKLKFKKLEKKYA